MDKSYQTYMTIIKDKHINKEIKIFIIMELLHSEKIGIKAAYELCTEVGIFSEHWVGLDAKTTELYEKIFIREN